jgi:hypothetical protein
MRPKPGGGVKATRPLRGVILGISKRGVFEIGFRSSSTSRLTETPSVCCACALWDLVAILVMATGAMNRVRKHVPPIVAFSEVRRFSAMPASYLELEVL